MGQGSAQPPEPQFPHLWMGRCCGCWQVCGGKMQGGTVGRCCQRQIGA